MTLLLQGLGLVRVIEGLALALTPSRIRAVLDFLTALPPDRARQIGLVAMAFGTVLSWLVRQLGV